MTGVGVETRWREEDSARLVLSRPAYKLEMREMMRSNQPAAHSRYCISHERHQSADNRK